RTGHPARWWSLTPPFHPYRASRAGARPARRSVLCGTVPRVTPGGRYPPPCPSEPGRSSARGTRPLDATVRPTRPHRQDYRSRAARRTSDRSTGRVLPVGWPTPLEAGSRRSVVPAPAVPSAPDAPTAAPAGDASGELAREQEFLENARTQLARMREQAGSLNVLAGDRVSAEYLEAALARRLAQLADDPEVPLFFGRIDLDDTDDEPAEVFHIGRRHV